MCVCVWVLQSKVLFLHLEMSSADLLYEDPIKSVCVCVCSSIICDNFRKGRKDFTLVNAGEDVVETLSLET